jgi:uncharacterized membrane protein
VSNSPQRVHFIDWARSIAIILMLQGHFITATFSNYSEMKSNVRVNGTSGYVIFDFWVQLRGLTAPLFFTITGLIFAFLLVKNHYDNPFKNPRVKKGVKRAIQIIIIGYILQLNIKNIPYYFSGRINDRFFAFHVLHCIGLGILFLILIYIISIYIKKIPLMIYLFVISITIFGLKSYFKGMGENYFPTNAPAVIQNIFNGKHSIFPFSPWIGYVLFGGFLGTVFRKYENQIKSKTFWYKYLFVSIGGLLLLIVVFYVLGYFFFGKEFAESSYTFFTLMKITLLLSILISIDLKYKFKGGMFAAMGQDTLFIYVFHTMILYGAFIGIGINTYFSKSLSGLEAILGAILFVLLFAVLVKYKPKIEKPLNSLKVKLRLTKNDKN